MEAPQPVTPQESQEEPEPEPLDTAVDLASWSADVFRRITETGAGEESIAELEELFGQTELLYEYFLAQGEEQVANHLNQCMEIYGVLLDTAAGAESFSSAEEKLVGIVESLGYPEQAGHLYAQFSVGDTDAEVETAEGEEETGDTLAFPEGDGNGVNQEEMLEDEAVFVPGSIENDIRFALTACFMRNLHEQEDEQGIISITLAGDTMFGEYPEVSEGFGFDVEFQERGGDLAFPLRPTAPYFWNVSLSVLNCEGTFTDAEEMAQKRFRFKGSAAYAEMFVNGGVEVVNLANNHTLDYLQVGYDDTRRTLEEHGIAYYGRSDYLVRDVGGVSFGFFGYEMSEQEPGGMEERIRGDISALRELGAKVIVATFHWGHENHSYPSDFQVSTGRLAVDLGADLVVGHHPHVLQGMEWYEGKLIIYSLGNFAFGGDHIQQDSGDTMLVRVSYLPDGNGGVEFQHLMVVPANVSTVTGRSNFVPRPLFGEEADRVAQKILDLSSALEYGITGFNYLDQEVALQN